MSNDLLTVRGCRMPVARAGTGETVLFLHGPEGAPAIDCTGLALLAERFEVVVPEHPGFGGADEPDWIENMRDLAFFYMDVIPALGIDRCHVVGHSLGGWLGMLLAMTNVTAVRSLTLVASAGLVVKEALIADPFLWNDADRAQHLFHDPALAARYLRPPATEAEIDAQLKNRFATARLAWEPRFHDPLLDRWIDRIKVPALALWGRDDRVIPPFYADYYAKRLGAGAEVVLLDACAHLPHLEQPNAFAAAVTRFLSGATR